MLVIVEVLNKFKVYLLRMKLKIVTDCVAFQKKLQKQDFSPCAA